MGYEIGDRIGTISHADKGTNTVYLYGFGEYKGESIPSNQVKGIGVMLREANVGNPMLVLDTGETLWGCECWWGSEDKVKTEIERYKNVVFLSIYEERTKK